MGTVVLKILQLHKTSRLTVGWANYRSSNFLLSINQSLNKFLGWPK